MVAILTSAIMLMQVLAITSFAEDINTFHPQRPAVGNMKITTGGNGDEETLVALRTNGTINIRAKDLELRGHGLTPRLKNELLSLNNVVDIACTRTAVAALKTDGTVYVGQHNQDEGRYVNPDAMIWALNDAAYWTDIVAIDCGEHHIVGLKADGTVVAAGDNSHGQCDVMGWNNISSIYANSSETFAIRKDGSVLATGLVENFSEIRKMENVKSLFYNHNGAVSYQTPNNYQALLNDGTTTCNMDYYEEYTLTQKDFSVINIGDKTVVRKQKVSLPINEVFKKLGYTTKIADIQNNNKNAYYVLDEAGDLYLISSYPSEVNIEKLEEKIISFVSDRSDYYALDENGQIWSNQAAFTSSDWILTTNITYDGKKIDSDVPPYVKDGRTLAPIRAILEALGMTVSWDGATQTATAVKGNITISVSINSNIAYVNGEQKMLDVPTEITNGRTFVPVRFFGEALGMNVDWDGYTKTVIIESK